MRTVFNHFVARHEVAWELTMGALAIVYLVLGFAVETASPAQASLRLAETGLTAIFVLEFGSRFLAADDRGGYLRGHWIDLLALVPSVRQFRLLRLLRLLRLTRTFASVYRALLHIERLLGNRRVATVGVIWLAILVLTSFGLFIAENGINPAVDSPLDALWWGVTTMTTVGYGDVYPVTGEGRLAAAILMLLGIALFSVVTATLTGLLVQGRADEPSSDDPIRQLERLHSLAIEGALSDAEYGAKKVELLARI